MKRKIRVDSPEAIRLMDTAQGRLMESRATDQEIRAAWLAFAAAAISSGHISFKDEEQVDDTVNVLSPPIVAQFADDMILEYQDRFGSLYAKRGVELIDFRCCKGMNSEIEVDDNEEEI